MRTLNLKLQGGYAIRPYIEIDGKVVPYKRNKNKSAVINYQTEKDVIKIDIANAHELNGPCWWLVQMCFYIISLFGIFNPKIDENLYLIKYSAKLHLADGENNITLKLNQTKDKGRAIDILGEGNVEEIDNVYEFDNQAKKRKKILKISHICAWVLLLATLVILVVTNII